MGYTDKIECPYCHHTIEVEVEIETEFGEHPDACAIIQPLPHHSQDGETHWDKLELERRLGK